MNAVTTPIPVQTDDRPLALRISPNTWLVLGLLSLVLVGMRFNVGVLAWVSPVPWLLYVRQTDGWKSRLLFMGALQFGMLLQMLKIITDPVPIVFAPLFSVPAALSMGLLYILFEWMRRRLGDGWGLLLFPAIVVSSEWIGWRTSDFGSWGASAYTQVENLVLLQSVSLVGMSGIALLMSLVAVWFAGVLSSETPTQWMRSGLIIAGLLMLTHAFGAVRLHLASAGDMVTVAAVVTDLGLSGEGLPTSEALAQNNTEMFARSRLAAERGAQLVVWNEGGTAVLAQDESALVAEGQALASELNVDLVMAYIVPHSATELQPYENKYQWLTPEGNVETYLKHFPVPGEGAIRGTAPIQVLDRPYGKVAGAICYDYDFPSLGMEHAAQQAGLVVVPSSDWRGIDPYHTQMAQMRGIEGGFSVLRPVRWATSAASDAYGRVRGSLSWFEKNDRILLAQVPVTHQVTLYSRIGDVLPWSASFLVFLGLGAAKPWRFDRPRS